MSATWNKCFASWAQAPSQTETDRIDNTITAIKKALAADPKVASMTKVFVQGSYRNRVNVRQDSDIDIGVLYTGNLFGTHYPPGKADADFNVIGVDYGYSHFKNDIEKALVSRFGRAAVNRGDKAFDIHENTYRVDCDVVPLMVHRRYSDDGTYICGTELQPDSGGRIINWPERLYDTHEWPRQHYENGNTKNNNTSRAYRGVVRIVKKLRNIMDEEGVPETKPIKGFNVECLVWNAPNNCFIHATWYEDVSAVLNHLSFHLSSMPLCEEWGEVSEWKYLLKNDDTKRKQFEAFVDSARRYIGIT
ncbi:nucleotidyltransferase [Pseudomonas sp. GL-R-19]|uniref:nucleotidyltransferase domain-containing protein n=1 Tax=Pseudomonas sp. GL-R-19 TaxID=2832391 RepID=UPI001CBFC7B2|nr:nucleotidyltransferase [Pseudomonas sp. GL-R-19]